MQMNLVQSAAGIVADAGGEIVGRTRLQKVAYFLHIAGLLDDFSFKYKHYGPYCEELADSIQLADLLGYVGETQKVANWGGTYSIFRAESLDMQNSSLAKKELAAAAANADSIELELAATAVYLSNDGFDDPWEETIRRKPEKASTHRIKNAKKLIKKLRKIETPKPIPELN